MKLRKTYLNNEGSRWVLFDSAGRHIRVELLDDNDKVIAIRRAKYFYSFGNYASVAVSMKGKVYKTLNYRVIYT